MKKAPLLILPLVLASCAKQPAGPAAAAPQKTARYTVMFMGRYPFPDMTYIGPGDRGDTFRTSEGKYITFRGNYYYYKQEEAE